MEITPTLEVMRLLFLLLRGVCVGRREAQGLGALRLAALISSKQKQRVMVLADRCLMEQNPRGFHYAVQAID